MNALGSATILFAFWFFYSLFLIIWMRSKRFFWTGFSNAISLVGINDFRLLILIAVTLP